MLQAREAERRIAAAALGTGPKRRRITGKRPPLTHQPAPSPIAVPLDGADSDDSPELDGALGVVDIDDLAVHARPSLHDSDLLEIADLLHAEAAFLGAQEVDDNEFDGDLWGWGADLDETR